MSHSEGQDVSKIETTLFKESNVFMKAKLGEILQPFHITGLGPLRELMVHTGCVISGSVALALLRPQQFAPDDIDFYVLPFGFPAVLQYVQQHAYALAPYEKSTQNYDQNSLVVVKLVHPVSRKSINVITGFGEHVINIITRFHSTLVMNYISWFGLVVLYPEWTLQKCGLVVANTSGTAKCIAKYTDRGYVLQREVFDLPSRAAVHVCHKDPYCSLTTRTLHDGHSFVEVFDPQGFDFEAEERDVMWNLPILCSFGNLDGNTPGVEKVV